jgi:hypothetical protein
MRWAMLIAALILAGCQVRGSNQPPCPGTGSTLVAIGQWSVVAGCAAVGAGVLATVASFFPWTAFLQAFRPAINELIALGVACILLGSSFIWLGTHAWLLAVVVVLVLAGLGFRYRGRIARFLGIPRKPPASKVANAAL